MALEQKLDVFLETFDPKKNLQLERIYRCPNCDAIILLKPDFRAIHNCSCGAISHIKNWKIEYEVA